MLTDDDDDSDDDEADDDSSDDYEKNNNSTNINKRIQKGVKFICNNNFSFSSRNKNSQAQTAHRRMCVVENEKKFDAL